MATKPTVKTTPVKKPVRKAKIVIPSKLSDLRGASYNPRTITDKELRHLGKSIDQFGDLSGIVFNVAGGVLVSGHQRVKAIKGKKTRLVKQKCKRDRQGTVATGIIEVKEADETLTRIPYREVEWTDKMTEMAANVAANMSGGEFDQVKLGAVMHTLEQNKFDIEMTGIDNWNLQKSIGKYKKSSESDGEEVSTNNLQGKEKKVSDKVGDFENVDPREMEFEHQCPKCKFKF